MSDKQTTIVTINSNSFTSEDTQTVEWCMDEKRTLTIWQDESKVMIPFRSVDHVAIESGGSEKAVVDKSKVGTAKVGN